MCSLRFSSLGKPLEGSRIWTRKCQGPFPPGSAPKLQPPWAWLLIVRRYSLGAGKNSRLRQILETIDQSQLNQICTMEIQTFPHYRVQKGCLQRAGLGMEELDWGWEELDWGWEELPVSSGTFAALFSLGFHCCLIFKYRYILCNICHIFIFQSDSLSEIQMGF